MNSYPLELRYILGPPVVFVDPGDEFYELVCKGMSTKQLDGKVLPIINTQRCGLNETMSIGRSDYGKDTMREGLLRSKWILDVCYRKPAAICFCVDAQRWHSSPLEVQSDIESLRYAF